MNFFNYFIGHTSSFLASAFRVRLVSIGVALIVWVSLSGCSNKDKDVQSHARGHSVQKVIHFACWGNTVSPTILDDFKKETGIEVKLSLYASNEELLAKLQAGASGYDLAVPSDYMVGIMRSLQLLHPVDHSKISNLKTIDPRFLKQKFDPDNAFSIPLDWGTSGIAINRTKTQKKIKSWKDVFSDPELHGKFSLLDDVRETLGLALKLNGFSLNSRSENDLKVAQETLIKAKSAIKAFSSEPMSGIVSGEFVVSHMYSSDAYQARQKLSQQIEYVIPEEGGVIWIDSLVIPKGAQNIEAAHQFANYLISKSVNQKNFERLFVAPVQMGIIASLPSEYKNDRSLFPSDWKKLEKIEELGDAMVLWDRIWTEIKVKN